MEHKYQATCYLLVGKIPWRRDQLPTPVFLGFHGGSDSKKSACNVGDLGSVPELGRSPGGGKGYPLQYSGRENSTDCIVSQRVSQGRTRLSDFHFSWQVVEGSTHFLPSPPPLPRSLKIPAPSFSLPGFHQPDFQVFICFLFFFSFVYF